MIWERFLAKLNIEWCTTVVFLHKVYLNMTKQCPKAQDCTPSRSVLNFFSSFHNTSLCAQNDQKQNLGKAKLVNGVQAWFSGLKFILTLPKAHDCTPYRSILKNFLVCIILYVLKMI